MNSRGRKIIIGVLALFLVLSVGYALFSETLNIGGSAKASGDFDLEFTSVGTIDKKGYTDVTNKDGANIAVISNDKNTLTITVNKLDYPGVYVKIPVVITNKGSIAANLKEIKETGLTEDNRAIKVSYEGEAVDKTKNKENNIYNPNESKDLLITVEWDINVNEISENVEFKIELLYEQATGSVSGGTINDGFEFPIVNGQLGQNVFFEYNNGDIYITGSGDMWSDPELGYKNYCSVTSSNEHYCTLGDEVAVKMAEAFEINDEKYKNAAISILSSMLLGNTLEDEGMTKEDFKQNLLLSEAEGGMGLSEEETDSFLKIIEHAPELKSITIQEGITSIRSELLKYIKIDSLTIPNSVASLSSAGLSPGNPKLVEDSTINTLNLGNGIKLEPYIISEAKINNIIIPEGITEIKAVAFYHVEASMITIPSTITDIGGMPTVTTIVNKTGKAFDWKKILTGTEGEQFVTGQVECYGRTVNIIAG